MSLKAIAEQELARLRAGEMTHETEEETRLKQVKQPVSCFIDASSRFTPMKHDEGQKTAINHPCFTVAFPKGETHETSLSGGIKAGLARLRSMPTIRTVNAGACAIVVRDALRVANDGWAGKALALGWTTLDLFGAVTDPAGDPYSDGLAVWLGGRKLLAICSTFAIAEDGNGRAYFNRHDQVGAKLLWELAA